METTVNSWRWCSHGDLWPSALVQLALKGEFSFLLSKHERPRWLFSDLFHRSRDCADNKNSSRRQCWSCCDWQFRGRLSATVFVIKNSVFVDNLIRDVCVAMILWFRLNKPNKQQKPEMIREKKRSIKQQKNIWCESYWPVILITIGPITWWEEIHFF